MKLEFSGVIDCNCDVVLDDLSESEVNAIKRFIDAIDEAICSYVEVYKLEVKDDE